MKTIRFLLVALFAILIGGANLFAQNVRAAALPASRQRAAVAEPVVDTSEVSPAIAAPIFTSVDFPGASVTNTYDANATTVVGAFNVDWTKGIEGTSFTYKGGVYKVVTVPNAASSLITGINASGVMVGYYFDAAQVLHGFVDSAGTITAVNYPGAADTVVFGINAAGTMVGYYYVSSTNSDHGFVYKGGKFTSVDFPGGKNTLINGINTQGGVVGSYEDSVQTHGFIETAAGAFTSIDFPGSMDTIPNGINDTDEIVGFYYDSDNSAHGFFYSDLYATLDIPGALFTVPVAIQNNGHVVGYYWDFLSARHGFTSK